MKRAFLGLSALLGLGIVGTPPSLAGREAPPPKAKGREPKTVEGELLVRFRKGTKAEEKRAACERLGTVLRDFSLHQKAPAGADFFGSLVHVRLHRGWLGAGDGQAVEEAIRARIACVESATPDRILPLCLVPDDAAGQYAVGEMSLPQAWDVTSGSSDVLVGVIDTGVDYTHPDLTDNIWSSPGETGTDGLGRDRRTNLVDDDGNGYIDDWRGVNFTSAGGRAQNDPMPPPTGGAREHGTHVAGIAAAVGDNGQGVCGVAWSARILPLACAIWDPGTQQWAISLSSSIAAIQYAVNLKAVYGVDVVLNMSYGSYAADASERAAVSAASQAGVVLVGAAGNDDSPSSIYPARYPEVVSVGASGPGGYKASFSNYGPEVDVSAPGVGILSTVPGGGYEAWQGTSMASPQVAGVAALMLSAGIPASEVPKRIQYGTSDTHRQNRSLNGSFGSGRADAWNPLRTRDDAMIPTVPASLTGAHGASRGWIRLEGTPAEDDRWVSGYIVERRIAGVGQFEVDPRWYRTFPVLVEGLAPETSYEIRVIPYDIRGIPTFASNVVVGVTLAYDPPLVSAPAVGGPLWLQPGQAGTFTAAASAVDAPVLRYDFLWGNGENAQAGPVPQGETVSAAYAWPAAATCTITVIATDDLGRSASATREVQVSATPPVPPGNIAPSKPSTPAGPATLLVGEIGAYRSSSTDPDSLGLRYTWIWGNEGGLSGWLAPGQVDTELHAWLEPGAYQVRVLAFDGALYSPASDPLTVTVAAAPSARTDPPRMPPQLDPGD